MARQIKGFRVVATNVGTDEMKVWTESRVEDGDLKEAPIKVELEVGEENTIDEIWAYGVEATKEAAGL